MFTDGELIQASALYDIVAKRVRHKKRKRTLILTLDDEWVMIENAHEKGVVDVLPFSSVRQISDVTDVVVVALRGVWMKVASDGLSGIVPSQLDDVLTRGHVLCLQYPRREIDLSLPASRTLHTHDEEALENMYVDSRAQCGIYVMNTDDGSYVRIHARLARACSRPPRTGSGAMMSLEHRHLALCALCKSDVQSVRRLCVQASQAFVNAARDTRVNET